MIKRRIAIIKEMREQTGPLLLGDLARTHGVSSRTIRNDILQIEDDLKSRNIRLLRNNRHGIFMERRDAESCRLAEYIQELEVRERAMSPLGRRQTLVSELLHGSGKETIQSLSKKTEASRSTTIVDLRRSERWLSERGVCLQRSPHYGIRVEANEFAYRNAILDHFLNSCSDHDICRLYALAFGIDLPLTELILDSQLQPYLKGVDFSNIRSFIQAYEQNMCLSLTDQSFLRLFLYICIALTRLKEGCVLQSAPLHLEWKMYVDVRAEKRINQHISLLRSEQFNTLFLERHGILAHLISSNLKYMNFSKCNIPLQSLEITNIFLETIENTLGLSFERRKALMRDLLLFFPAAIERHLNRIICENPDKQDIQRLYPNVFSVCQQACHFLEKRFGTPFSEDELSVLTMLIVSAMELVDSKMDKPAHLRIAVVCPNGVSESKLLCSNLVKKYPHFEIVSVLSMQNFLNHPPDSVLTIGTLPFFNHYPYIEVSPFLLEEDLRKIDYFLARHRIRTRSHAVDVVNVIHDVISIVEESCEINNRQRLYERLTQYFNDPIEEFYAPPSLSSYLRDSKVSINFDTDDCMAAIRESGRLLYEQGCVEPRYIDSMVNSKERLGSYIVILPRVAMPHARSCDGVLRTGFSFVTTKEPLLFGHSENDPVRLIIGLAANNNMQHVGALLKLISIVKHIDLVKSLCNCTSQEMFIKQLEHEARKYKDE